MNYALDALWWRLRVPVIRDLASLLTAPAPWHSGSELPVRTLLGDSGFRYLLALDDNPTPLLNYLSNYTSETRRLGRYAEYLLSFWFTCAPHAQLLAYNYAIHDGEQTLGAVDFIVRLNDIPYHLELTCKYYGGATVAALAGLNPQDRLVDKAAKILRQLDLSRTDSFQATLNYLGIAESTLQRATIIRGQLFLPAPDLPTKAPLNRLAWQGWWGTNWPIIWTQLAHTVSDEIRCAVVERVAQLAPRRLPESDTMRCRDIESHQQGMIALLQQRPDGYWHEILRIMKMAKQ